MDLGDLIHKQFDLRNYNCYHFARDVWRHVTGKELPGVACPRTLLHAHEIVTTYTDPLDADRPMFRELYGAKSPCIAVFSRRGASHVGVYLDGRVLHLGVSGARHESIESVKAIHGYRHTRFFEPC
jgi:cell wall-associated NlpC family hydrolase